MPYDQDHIRAEKSVAVAEHSGIVGCEVESLRIATQGWNRIDR
jgi:hypothetical protein